MEASFRYLEHLSEAWDATVAKGDPALKLAEQEVVITVPASFDAGARELTVEAATAAGIEHLTLLEEPQAALYAWIDATKPQNTTVEETRKRIAMLDRACRLDDTFADAFHWRGQLHKRIENHSAAMRDFRKVVELNPKHLEAVRELRVYEMPISYYGRTYEEGKNITWRDGFRAVYVLLRTRVRPLRAAARTLRYRRR